MPKVGAHVSAAVSLDLSFERAKNIGAECSQIFISPPGQWAQVPHSEEAITLYRKKGEGSNISPNFIHAAYLINLASPNKELVQKSVDWLKYSQKEAERLRVVGTILHIGSYKGTSEDEAIKQVAESLQKILESTKTASIILENNAGAGNLIGDKFKELGQIIKMVGDHRVKICLDTQHAYASGYNIKTGEGLVKTLTEFDQEIGLDRLAVIHANDSKVELGSNRDRHENIGEGFIGIEGFKNIINHPALKNIPFILEVPGFSGGGPDKENLYLLKSLVTVS